MINCTILSSVKSRHFSNEYGFLSTYVETRLLWESATASSFTTSSPSLPSKQVTSITGSANVNYSCGYTYLLFIPATCTTVAGPGHCRRDTFQTEHGTPAPTFCRRSTKMFRLVMPWKSTNDDWES